MKNSGSPHITGLLIEDNPRDARLIQEMLKNPNKSANKTIDIQLDIAGNLLDGLKKLDNNHYDVILLDLTLPDSQGLDTFETIHVNANQIPVIVLSGLDDKTVAIQAVHDGAQDYLVKGHVDEDLLIRAIGYAIERKRVEEEKNKIQTQLFQAQKLEAIGVLAGGIAHDFNNLMTTIQGFTDVILMKTDDSDPSFHALQQIRSSASSAADLTRQMLLFSRSQPMEFSSINLNKIIENLLKMLHRLIGEDITIGTSLDPDLQMIQADLGTIEQTLMNIVINAKEAMPEGGQITIKTKNIVLDKNSLRSMPEARAGRFIKLTVNDTGIGMSQEMLQHIFEPFYTTKGQANRTGLGLSVVYGIVKQHEGWINVFSSPGKGTTFDIYFPVLPIGKSETEKTSPSLDQLQGKNKRILLVEDSEGVREFAAMVLSENGYSVYSATTVEEALDVFKKENGEFDLVISDVVLPDKSGLKLAEELNTKNPGLPILLSSGYTDQKLQWPIIREKGFRFLQKPYAFIDLLKAVKDTLS
jgi:two-component system cell cycle sensor histidine kinase/response regulator CckA